VQWLDPPSGEPQGALRSGADRTSRRAEPHDLAIAGSPTDAKNEVAAGGDRRRLRFQAEHNNPLARALDGSAERHRPGVFPSTPRLGTGRQNGGPRRARPPRPSINPLLHLACVAFTVNEVAVAGRPRGSFLKKVCISLPLLTIILGRKRPACANPNRVHGTEAFATGGSVHWFLGGITGPLRISCRWGTLPGGVLSI
jgi:hypothetical protein